MSYCEIPEFFDESWQIARKEHSCCECNQPILKGEKYYRCAGKWDGQFSTFKQHKHCLDACVSIRDFQDNECIPFGAFYEWYHGHDYYKKDWPEHLRKSVAKLLIETRKRKSNGTLHKTS